MRPAAVWVFAYAIASVSSTCWSAVGDILCQYESCLGTLPARQGWSYESHCLKSTCPSNADPPSDPWGVCNCYYQGVNGNDCTLGHGCGPDVDPYLNEHFNAPGYKLHPYAEVYSNTEWLAFDDGEDFLDEPYPVPLPNRNLTFASDDGAASIWPPHTHPAFGAPGFDNAPVGYWPLRIVTGGGVYGVDTLPSLPGNQRNTGRIELNHEYAVSPGAEAVTVVAKMACGNRAHLYEMLRICGLGYGFALGVNGEDGTSDVGTFRWGTTQSDQENIFESKSVKVALARPDLRGPHDGEFFTVRIILNSNGAVEAWLNEDVSDVWTGTASPYGGTVLQINSDTQAGTMWLDYVRLYEGAIPPDPPLCGDPVFDINHDGRVNHLDRFNGTDGFLDCATGPAPPAGMLDSLAPRCACHDVNHDGAIDLVDFAAFQRCLTVEDVPADPTCVD